MQPYSRVRGITLVELIISLVIAGLLMASINGLFSTSLQAYDMTARRNALDQSARFALQRITLAVADSDLLLVPQEDATPTNWREHVREQTEPPSPPEGSSVLATAVLAIALGASQDLDGDGVADADNDGDGRINEDPSADISFDFAPGVYLIDDDGDGQFDENPFSVADDDERSGFQDEDPINGIDDDGDGRVDEDPGADLNGDGTPGVAGVDDDGDGYIDESTVNDDDEDGVANEDWFDAVVFYMEGSELKERRPVPWDQDGGGIVSGRDFMVSTIAEHVSRFRVERVEGQFRLPLVDIVLELTDPDSQASVSVHTRVRIGSEL